MIRYDTIWCDVIQIQGFWTIIFHKRQEMIWFTRKLEFVKLGKGKLLNKAKKHSNRMRTTRLLPVGVCCLGGHLLSLGGCVLSITASDIMTPHFQGVRTSPVNRMTDRCKNITLPDTSFAGGNKCFLITARKRSFQRLCFYTCLSTGGCYPSIPCSRSRGGGWYRSMPCRFPGPHWGSKLKGIWPTTKGEVEGDLARRSPGPHPRGKLRGIWPGGSPGPHPGGVCSQGGKYLLWGVPSLGGLLPGGGVETPPIMATAAGSTHPTGMHSCLKRRLLFKLVFLNTKKPIISLVRFFFLLTNSYIG